ncbi:MAG: hypothetical protein KKE61_04695 [Proteobacteria bacterium]|nr:hypothetical protein [Pseudomonadota bacterium]
MGKIISVEISKKIVVINTVTNLLTYFFSITLLIWVQQYLLRRISPEEYSLLPIVGSLVMFTPIITTIFIAGIGRYLVEAYAEGNELQVTKIVSSIWPILFISGIIFSLLSFYLSINIESILHIPKGYEEMTTLMLLVAFFNLLMAYILSPFLAGFNIRQKFYLGHFIDTIFEIFRIILLLLLLFKVSTSVLWVVVASSLSNVLKLIVKIIISCRLVPALRMRIRLFDFSIAKTVISFGVWSSLGQIGYRIRTAADPILLNLFTTPLDITTFHLGSMFRRQFDSFLPSLTSSLQPALIAMHAKKEKERLKYLFYRLNKYLMWVTLLFISPLLVYRQELISLYVGNEYIEAASVLGLLFVPAFLGMSIQLIWSLAPAIGKIKHMTIISFSMQLCNLTLTIILLKYFNMGAIGCALSTCITAFISLVLFFLPLAMKLLNGKISEWFYLTFLPGLLPAISALTIYGVLKMQFDSYSWMKLGCCFIVGSIGYIITVVLCMNTNDKIEVIEMITGIRSKIVGFKNSTTK